MNGKLSFNISADKKQRDELIALIAFSIIADSLDKKQFFDSTDISSFESVIPSYLSEEIQSNSKLKTKLRRKINKALQKYSKHTIVDAQSDYVSLSSKHPLFRFNLFKVEAKHNSPSQPTTEHDLEDLKEILLGIDDHQVCQFHPTEKCILSSTPFTNIVTFSALNDVLRLVIKQPEPTNESTMIIRASNALDIEVILSGAIDYSTKNVYVAPKVKEQDSEVGKSKKGFILPTNTPTDDIELLLSDKNVLKEAMEGLEQYNREIYTKTGPIQQVLLEKEDTQALERRHVISSYMNNLAKSDPENSASEVFTKPLEYLEMPDPNKSFYEIRESSMSKLVEIEIERRARESEVKLLETISKSMLQYFSVNNLEDDLSEQKQFYPRQMLDMKVQYETAFKTLEVEGAKKDTISNLKTLLDSQVQYMIQYEKFLHDKYLKIKEQQIKTAPAHDTNYSSSLASFVDKKNTTQNPLYKKAENSNTSGIVTPDKATSFKEKSTPQWDHHVDSSSHTQPRPSSPTIFQKKTTEPTTTTPVSSLPKKPLFEERKSVSEEKKPTTPTPVSSPRVNTTAVSSSNVKLSTEEKVAEEQISPKPTTPTLHSTTTSPSSEQKEEVPAVSTNKFSDLRSRFAQQFSPSPVDEGKKQPISMKGRTGTVLQALSKFEKKKRIFISKMIEDDTHVGSKTKSRFY